MDKEHQRARDRNRQALAWWASAAPRRLGYLDEAARLTAGCFARSMPSCVDTVRHGLAKVLETRGTERAREEAQ